MSPGLLPAETLIVQRRFIPMVAIGNEERLPTHDVNDLPEHGWVSDRPELLPASVIVLKVDSWRLAFDRSFEQSENRVLRIE